MAHPEPLAVISFNDTLALTLVEGANGLAWVAGISLEARRLPGSWLAGAYHLMPRKTEAEVLAADLNLRQLERILDIPSHPDPVASRVQDAVEHHGAELVWMREKQQDEEDEEDGYQRVY